MITVSKYRWSDNDKYWGPFTYAPNSDHGIVCLIDSGEDEYPGCRIRLGAFGGTLLIAIPAIIQPWRKKVIVPEWRTNGTAERLGRDWYFDEHRREYGFSYSCDLGGVGGGGFLQVFFGRQTHDGSTTQSWSRSTPWNNWSHVRHSFYDLNGEHFHTTPRGVKPFMSDEWEQQHKIEEACPSRTFFFSDFDGELIECKTRIEEREWRLGTGWFKWLGVFKKPIVHRSLDLDFSKETGRRKGSWKGGTTGHAIEMLPGELHEAAFKRYCEGDDKRHGKKRDMKFIGEVV